MDFGINGKTAIVMAASKGLGFGAAMALAKEGANVVMCARDEEGIRRAADEVGKVAGGAVLPVAADVSKAEEIAKLVSAAEDRFGAVNISVLNAGGPPPVPLDQISDDDWRSAFELTHLSAIRVIRATLPKMREARWGRIILIGSSSVKQPVANLHLSNGIRPGLVGFMKSLADGSAVSGVTVNTVLPGVILTDRIVNNAKLAAKNQGISLEKRLDDLAANIPCRRFGKVEEVGALVAFLASVQASYITGSTYQVDGGLIRSNV